jgi:hypothetical protein
LSERSLFFAGSYYWFGDWTGAGASLPPIGAFGIFTSGVASATGGRSTVLVSDDEPEPLLLPGEPPFALPFPAAYAEAEINRTAALIARSFFIVRYSVNWNCVQRTLSRPLRWNKRTCDRTVPFEACTSQKAVNCAAFLHPQRAGMARRTAVYGTLAKRPT